MFTRARSSWILKQANLVVRSELTLLGGGRVNWASRPKWAPFVIAFLVCNAIKATVIVFTDPSGDVIQRRICFFLARMQNGD